MKTKLIIILMLHFSCLAPKKVIGIYVLTKKANSHNLILKLEKNKRYELRTLSTIGGVTYGNWINISNNSVKLFPDKSIIEKVTQGDSLVDVQEFRPFSDTIIMIRKGSKLYFTKKGDINKSFYLKKVK